MARIIVAGGRGFFGRTIVELLRMEGLAPLVASRKPGSDLVVDVENASLLRSVLRSSDLLVDTAGPFQDRSAVLVETAMEVGFHVIDLSDSVAYARKVWSLRDRVNSRGVRVLTGCSAMSAISAALVRHSGICEPERVTGFIAPSSRHSANTATGVSLLRSVGQPIEVLRGGRYVHQIGWLDRRTIDLPPLGRIRGHLFETVDSFLLPQVWPSLRTSEFFVDSRVPGLNMAFTVAGHWPIVRRAMERFQSVGIPLARRFGATAGGLGYEIEGAGGTVVRYAIAATDHAYRIGAAPAALAARNIALDRFQPSGMVECNQLVAPQEFFNYLTCIGAQLQQS